MRTLSLSIGFALVALCAQGVKSRGLEVVSGEIDGTQVFYVRDELLIKPVNDIDISGIAESIGAAVLDSMSEIGWHRLKLGPDVDALPMCEDLRGSPGSNTASCTSSSRKGMNRLPTRAMPHGMIHLSRSRSDHR